MNENQNVKDYKVLTVIQPFATMLVNGTKTIETRSWDTNYRGKILIHAAKRKVWHPINNNPFNENIKLAEVYKNAGFSSLNDFNNLPLGAIIGSVEITDSHQIDKNFAWDLWNNHFPDYATSEIFSGWYAWDITNPIAFSHPLTISGKQGFWKWTGNIDELI